MDKLKKPSNSLDLNDIDADEAKIEEAKLAQIEPQTRGLLEGFIQANVKIHLLSGKLEKLFEKKKYKNLFDLGVLSVNSANEISQNLSILFKDQAKVHCETADNMIILKQEQRVEFRKAIVEKVKAAKWTVQEPAPFSHHMMLQVHHQNV